MNSAATTRRELPIAALILTCVAVAARARTFGDPVIGFDEQFYLLVGDRMWNGMLPFVDIFDRKPIGLFLLYALADGLGRDAFLGYKLLALFSVLATAWLIFRLARREAGPVGALTGAVLYILWLNFMEGEGGQAPVFYNLAMVAAVTVIARARPTMLLLRGTAAMVLVGIALQIKYSVLVEGIYLGCVLIGMAWRDGKRGARLGGHIAVWVGSALLPTALAFAFYAATGHETAFLFANFLSVLGQGRAGGAASGAGVIVVILAPLLALLIGRWRQFGASPDRRFLRGWLIAAVAGLVVYGRFASPHYAMPLLVPLCILLGPAIDASRSRRWVGFGLACMALVAGQIVLAVSEKRKGGAEAARAVAHAAHTERGCIYVFDGYPALYMLTGSCLPTRWAFPGHLSLSEESNPAALGIDPLAELRRVLTTRPVAIIDDFPRFAGGNPAAHAILQVALDRDYALAACVPTGPERRRLVYRRKTERPVRPATCPSDAALRIGHLPEKR